MSPDDRPFPCTADEETCQRAGHHLRMLAERLDPPSFELLLKVMSGINRAFAHRDQPIDLDLTPEERALYTPRLQEELLTLLELSRLPRSRVRTEPLPDTPNAPPPSGGPPSLPGHGGERAS
ncbi:hypothetical protein E0L36_01195 [Streptomyces sp. AJS327]|uniref:hypothetical protein n=1 Tax=Streptomyces sp. AJS327 TaxID=2545265 RepID=UPI0015DEF5BB|nr:hypothetical protein [Streptomyces sp. AJS327]MBA0049573.1 hypothetical protein [Streptomyces sp. AJS327]